MLLDSDNYHSFVRVLKQREDDHKDILKILYEKYTELGESVHEYDIYTTQNFCMDKNFTQLAFRCIRGPGA